VRVLFVANWRAGAADDEGAVAHALTALGHEVARLDERDSDLACGTGYDLCLFFKWCCPAALARMKCAKAFWFFDLVDYHDSSIAPRCAARRQWMRKIMPTVDLGFCTDGDWVAKGDRYGKLVWLPQGADGRILGVGRASHPAPPFLFTGIRNGGRGRASFVDEMRARYGGDFRHVASGVYRRELADLIASSEIVVAPDAPVTDRYASNRIFNVLGFGGFLLHPRCAFLEGMYEDRREVVYYRDRGELHDLIAYYRARPDERRAVAEAGLARTLKDHLYEHRVAELIRTAKERLGLP
jgi:hypothetical protein